MVSLRTFFVPESAAEVRATYDLYFTGPDAATDEFHAIVDNGVFTITRGATGTAGTAVHTGVPAFIAVVSTGTGLRTASPHATSPSRAMSPPSSSS
ncbi:hypothetical protein [Nocardia sp. NPDC051463]|uniref:hypothetical protein n=1 Tax=Nocardia sp. NPDC051463 TaxID=3154845 RepID=UPI003446CC72